MKAKQGDTILPPLCGPVAKGTPQSQSPECFKVTPKNLDEATRRPDHNLWISALRLEAGFDGD